MTDAILQVSGLVKHFGGLHVLDGIDMSIRRGTITGLLGPNGSGKTTMFNVLSGFLRPDVGSILLDGKPITGLPPHLVARAGMGRTFQLSRVFGGLTVLENMLVPFHTEEQPGHHLQERARELLSMVQLDSKAHALGKTLSYGQRKLLEFARVLMLRPTLLLLDEPFAGVNPVLREQMGGMIRSLAGRGTTCLVIGHEMSIMMALCEEVVVLNAGRLIYQGEPAACRRDPVVIEAYLGSGRGRGGADLGGTAAKPI